MMTIEVTSDNAGSMCPGYCKGKGCRNQTLNILVKAKETALHVYYMWA